MNYGKDMNKLKKLRAKQAIFNALPFYIKVSPKKQ